MEILKNCEYFLRFRINQNLLKTYKNRWEKLKGICEMGANKRDVCCKNCGYVQQEYLGVNENVEDIFKLWIIHCRLETNKSLLYIDIPEGGVYNPNKRACQLFFRNMNAAKHIIDNDIVIEIVNLSQDVERWTYQELDDLRNAFVEMTFCKIGINIDSCIEMKIINTSTNREFSDSGSDGESDFESNQI